MTLSLKTQESLLERGYSRRQIGRILGGAAAAVPFFNEFAMAQQAEQRTRGGGRRAGGGGEQAPYDPEVVRITSNENPMGPTKEGIAAMATVGPLGWRYDPRGENMDFAGLLEKVENVKPGYVHGYPGSSIPLANSVAAFASPTRPWVMGSPGYGAGGGKFVGNKVIQVPLRKDFSHDVEAMIKADPNAGAYYICNPNNPTGTLTSKADFEYILANKPKDAVLVIDEAYVHFAGPKICTPRTSCATTRTSWCCAPSRRSTAWPACAPAHSMAARTCWPRSPSSVRRPPARDRDGLRRGQHEDSPHHAAGAHRDQQEESRPGLRAHGKDRACPTSRRVELLHDLGEGHDRRPRSAQRWRRRRSCSAGANRWPEWPDHIRVTVGTYEEMGKFNAALSEVVKEGPKKA